MSILVSVSSLFEDSVTPESNRPRWLWLASEAKTSSERELPKRALEPSFALFARIV